jgi:hypothetical protein
MAMADDTAERFGGAFVDGFALPKGVDTNAITPDYADADIRAGPVG